MLRNYLAWVFLFGLTITGFGQVPGGHAIVASEFSGATTGLFSVDLATGAISPLSPFPSAQARPLALTLDPINQDVVLAIELPPAQTRLLRLRLSGLSIVSEVVIRDIPGTATDLVVEYLGDAYVTTVGAATGLWNIPRSGAAATLLANFARPVSITSYGYGTSALLVGESGSSSPPTMDPKLHYVDVAAPSILNSNLFAASQPPEITDLADLPTALPRTILTHPDGTVSLSVFFGTPTPFPVTPALPPGSTVAMELYGFFDPLVLGGAPHPFLKTFSWSAAAPTWTNLAGPIPGNPVHFAVAPSAGAQVLAFGAPCGHQATPLNTYGATFPTLGNPSFTVQLTGAMPNDVATLGVGANDTIALGTIPLPYTLPNGCTWWIDPALLIPVPTTPLGLASVSFAIPNDPALDGFTAFAQWIQLQGGNTAVSGALAVRLGP